MCEGGCNKKSRIALTLVAAIICAILASVLLALALGLMMFGLVGAKNLAPTALLVPVIVLLGLVLIMLLLVFWCCCCHGSAKMPTLRGLADLLPMLRAAVDGVDNAAKAFDEMARILNFASGKVRSTASTIHEAANNVDIEVPAIDFTTTVLPIGASGSSVRVVTGLKVTKARPLGEVKNKLELASTALSGQEGVAERIDSVKGQCAIAAQGLRGLHGLLTVVVGSP